LNKIFLLNNGAKVTADYSNEEESTGMVAEGRIKPRRQSVQ
jgi:hypothetical protein